MPVFACLIVGEIHLAHNQGQHLDLGVSTVRYVHASHEDEAREKGVDKFLAELNLSGKTSNEKMIVEKVVKTKFWALWSRELFWAWSLSHPDRKKTKPHAIKTALEKHKYIE